MNNGTVALYQDNSAHGEDSHLIRELGSISCLDAVLDGVSQCEGAYASGFTAQVLQEAPIESVRDLIDALERANQVLFQSGKGRNLLTTLSAALKLGNELHTIAIGDSPAYLVRGGKLTELTTTVRSSAFPSQLSDAVGLRGELAYQHNELTLRPHDVLILSTDGLINNVFPQELAEIAATCASPAQAVTAIGELVAQKRRDHRGRDDTYGTFREDDQTAIIRYLT